MQVAALAPHELTLLAALAYLSLKHFFADYCVQTPYQFMNKGKYGHPGGLLHSAIHAVATIPVIFILKPTLPQIAAAIIALEFVVHYHIDWSKEQINRRARLNPSHARFWQLFGLDQLLHGLTYIAIAAALIVYAGA